MSKNAKQLTKAKSTKNDINDINDIEDAPDNITIPSTEEFDTMLKEQNDYEETKKWADLEIGKIYVITNVKTIETKTDKGESTIITVKDVGEVWAPSHLATKIADKEPPFYVRPLGLKPCKKNRKNKYHAYDLVVPKRNQNNQITCIKTM